MKEGIKMDKKITMDELVAFLKYQGTFIKAVKSMEDLLMHGIMDL